MFAAALLQLGKSLEAELKLAKVSNVGVHNLSPGMVTTELLMSGANTPTAKFFINCLGGWGGCFVNLSSCACLGQVLCGVMVSLTT